MYAVIFWCGIPFKSDTSGVEIFVGQSPSESLSLESLSSPSWHRHGRGPGVVPCDGSTSLVAKLVSGLLCGKTYYIYTYIVDCVYYIYSIHQYTVDIIDVYVFI